MGLPARRDVLFLVAPRPGYAYNLGQSFLRSGVHRRPDADPAAIRDLLESFLATCREPVVVEPGEKPLALEQGQYSIEPSPGGCLLEVWGSEGSLVRRISAILTDRPDRLEAEARSFGRASLRLAFYDRARTASAAQRAAERRAFTKTFRRILQRGFPDASLSPLSSAADLPRSLSPVYTRGKMVDQGRLWSVIAAPEDAGASSGLLTYGLIWLALTRSRERRRAVTGLRLFVPQGREAHTAARLPWLTPELRFELWTYNRRGDLQLVEPETAGNLHAEAARCYPRPRPDSRTAGRLAEILARADVDATPLPEGAFSLRVRGIEFAQAAGSVMTFGLESRTTVDDANFPEVVRLADRLARFRRPNASDLLNPLYTRYPERWLESQFRRDPQAVDPSLVPTPIYSHVAAVAGTERGVLDLLAHDVDGRLAVVELKTAEDIHLPLQGLDYWLRIRLLHRRGELVSQGYFDGFSISDASPRLLLVSPALDFHPTTETILSFFRNEITVERVGLSGEWRARLQASFRLSGAERP